MPTIFTIVFWIHLVVVGIGGAAIFGIPVIGARMERAESSARPDLIAVMNTLSMMGRGALLVALISGPWMVIAKFGGFGGLGPWFHAKMGLVALFAVSIIWAGVNGARAASGDMAAVRRAPLIGVATIVLFVAVIFAAVSTFG